MGNIAGSYNAGTGVLTLTSAGHSATAAQWQTALASVQYYDSSDTPSTTNTRTVTSSITDSSANVFSLGTSTITVVSVDDSPILNTGVAVSLPHGTEDAVGAPTGSTAGFLVSSLAGTSLNVTDPDGSSTAAATTGIAITHADTTEGNWWYTTNNGTTWTQMTAITGSNVLQLVANANTRIYFQPTVANWNGQIANGMTFRAWDQFNPATPGTPVANGTYADLSAITNYGQNAVNNTTGSAYSIATDTLPLTIDAVNDAPIASGSASLPSITIGDPPTSATITSLFNDKFNDQKDQQFTVSNTTGSTANTLAGIAITANASTSGEGVWKYSLDNGTTWVAIPTTGLTNTSALVLPKTAMLEFVGASGFSGTPGALTTRLIDTSTTAITGVGTGLSLSTAATAFTGIDVSTNGGITAISAATVDLSTAIDPVVVVSTPLNHPTPPSDTLSQERDALYNGAGHGGYIFTGGIDTDWLVGENVFRVMEVGIPGTANVSADVFYGTVPKQNLSYTAVSLAGGALPPWLFFDPGTLRFTGTPPDGSEGTVDARVIARDFKGREAAADVHIVVVREQREILGLLRTSNRDRPPITLRPGNQAPDTGNGRPVIGNPPANAAPRDGGAGTRGGNGTPPAGGNGGAPQGGDGGDAPRGNGQTGSLPSVGDGRQAFGLSPQLREFSQAGRLARARGLLNALSAGPASL
jgi:large repetitive protein